MKIAQVVCAYPPYNSGIGTSAKKLQDILQKENDSFVFTTERKDDGGNKDKVIRVKSFLKLGNGAVLFRLFKELKKFDLIYFHFPFFGTSLIIYLFKILNKDKKLIIHYHMDVKQKNIIFKILSLPEEIIKNYLFKKADKIICASFDYIKNSKLKNYYKKYPEKFIEIPFFVNKNDFYPNEEKKRNKNKKQILFVGGLDKAHYFKGLEILIKAFSEAKIENTELVICGEGELKNDYQKLTKKINIEDKVVFSGRLSFEELKEAYQMADVLILPSINSNEAFGIVLIEAMASKTTVIASNLPGVRSVFENNISGLITEVNDINDLKEKIEKIINNDKLREEMEENAYQLFLKKYEEKVIENKILESIKLI
ncbi:MAG: glycosyltransferase family 4 protein [Patescibacteria group bacterium]